MSKPKNPDYFALAWTGRFLRILDQTKLPHEEIYLDLKNAEDVWGAIRNLRVRGAPATTFDLDIPDGESIPIEKRHGDEVAYFGGKRIAPPGIKTCNPAFDVTPASLITAFITDRGVIKSPYSCGKFRKRLRV